MKIKKLYAISFEGLNLNLVKQWVEKGYLKNFKRLFQLGMVNSIKCSIVPYEASGLVSALSGLADYEHGVYSYWHANNSDYRPQIYPSDEIKEKMLWNSNTLRDKKFGIVNIFGTHPVYEINGYMLSYAMERTLKYMYPPKLRQEFTQNSLYYIQDMYAFYKNQGKKEFLQEVLQVEEARHCACKELLKKKVDIFIANYTSIDRICHFFMHELRDLSMPLEKKAVFIVYDYLDKILGEYIDYATTNDSELILFSSVGFGHLKKFVEINKFLYEKGYLHYKEDQRIPDFSRTIAFESVQGTHGININKSGFYEEGLVSEDEFDSLRDELIRVLKTMQNPYNENPMFKNVLPKEAIYPGSQAAPDIILEPYDWEYLPYGDALRADQVGRHNQSGWHRNQSMWGYLGSQLSVEGFNKVESLVDLGNVIKTIAEGVTI